MDEADKDRERYAKEMEQYQQTEAYKLFTKKKLEGKRKLEMGDDAENQINGAGGEVKCYLFGGVSIYLQEASLPIFHKLYFSV